MSTMIQMLVALTLATSACGLKVKKDIVPVEVIGHEDEPGKEGDVSKETAGVFAKFDKDRNMKLDLTEYREFLKSDGEEEETTESEFRDLQLAADPDREHGPVFLTMNDYQTLVNADKLIGAKIVPSEESIKTERKEWLNTRQFRHGGFTDKLKDIMVESGDKMVAEIFSAFDGSKDGNLQIDEFNRLQEATEGAEGHYNTQQFVQLLDQADPEREQEGLSFDTLKNMYMNPDFAEEFQTELPGDYEKLARSGHIEATAVPKELADEFKTVEAKVEEQPKEEDKAEEKKEVEKVEEKVEEKKEEKHSPSSFINEVTSRMF